MTEGDYIARLISDRSALTELVEQSYIELKSCLRTLRLYNSTFDTHRLML